MSSNWKTGAWLATLATALGGSGSAAWASESQLADAPEVPAAVDSAPAPIAAAGPAPRPRLRGSLYSDAQFEALTGDKRRFRVGEILTVLVHESASATSTADTGAARESDVGLGVTVPRWSKSAGIVANNDFSGTGRTQRAGRVLAQITVLVHEVLPNGDLRVAGEQLLEINGEKQTIRAEGRVRPRDVNEHNVVLSNRLAEARLALVGDGVIADQQRPRWWQRLLGMFGI